MDTHKEDWVFLIHDLKVYFLLYKLTCISSFRPSMPFTCGMHIVVGPGKVVLHKHAGLSCFTIDKMKP